MPITATEPHTLTSIIDNQHGNTLQNALEIITENGRELWIATAFFSLDALNMVGENLVRAQRVRLRFGDDSSAKQRNTLIRAMQVQSDADLLKQRETDPLLNGLRLAKQLIDEGRIEARVYTKEKFHAKLYISHRSGYPPADPRAHYLDNKLYVRLGNSTEELSGRKMEDWLRQRPQHADNATGE